MEIMAIKLSDHIIIKRGSRPNPLSKYEIYDLNSNNNAIPYPIQSDINKNSLMLNKYKKMFKINLGFKFEPAIKGDLLLSSSCDIGNAVILDLEKAFIDDKFFNVKTSPNLSKKYLQYWLLKNKKEISELGHGTTFKVLYLEPFKKYIDKIFLPNLDEQQQIINIIEPFERLKEKFNIKIKYLKDILHNHDKKSKEIDILNNWAKITTGKRNANYAIQNGNYRFFSCSINKIQFCNSFSFDCESLLLAGNGDIGNVIYFNGKFDAYQRTYVIQCKNFIGNIYFSLVKNKKFFESNSKGSVIKFLTLSTISNIKISLNKEINNIRLAILKYIFICEKIVFNTNLIIDLIIKKMIN